MHMSVGFRLHMCVPVCVCIIFQRSDSPLGRVRYLDQTPEKPVLSAKPTCLPCMGPDLLFLWGFVRETEVLSA